LISAARETATWLLSAHMGGKSCSSLIEMYETELDKMLAQLKTLLCGQLGQFYGERLSSLEHDKLSPETAVRLAAHPFISVLLEMLWSASQVGVPAGMAVKAYSAIMQYLGLNILVRREQGIETRSKWEYEMLIQSYHDIRRGVSLLTTKLLRRGVSDEAAIAACLEGDPLVERLRAAVLELNTKSPEVALVSVIAHQVRVVANHDH